MYSYIYSSFASCQLELVKLELYLFVCIYIFSFFCVLKITNLFRFWCWSSHYNFIQHNGFPVLPRRSDFVSPNLPLELCSLATKGTQEFGDWINREFEIPTAEKQVMRSLETFVFDAMFCRLATMGVANSRLD